MAVSKARIRANAKYNLKAYDRLEMKVKKGNKEKILSYANENGESLNNYLKRAVKKQIKDETGNEIEL